MSASRQPPGHLPDPTEMERTLFVAHRLPGRMRLRLWRGLERHPLRGEDLVRAVEKLPQVRRARFHPTTHSIVVEYDADRHPEEAVVDSVRLLLDLDRVHYPGEASLPPSEMAMIGTRLARSVAGAVADLNADIYRASRGTVDLRILLPMTFGALGVAEVAYTRKLPAPPWFNLMWWSFRTFTTFNADAIAHARDQEQDAAAREARGKPAGPGKPPTPRARGATTRKH